MSLSITTLMVEKALIPSEDVALAVIVAGPFAREDVLMEMLHEVVPLALENAKLPALTSTILTPMAASGGRL